VNGHLSRLFVVQNTLSASEIGNFRSLKKKTLIVSLFLDNLIYQTSNDVVGIVKKNLLSNEKGQFEPAFFTLNSMKRLNLIFFHVDSNHRPLF